MAEYRYGGYKSCASPWCNNTAIINAEVSYFRFPRDWERCLIWISNCGLKESKENLSINWYKNYRLCGAHFEKSMFSSLLKNRLKKTAIPTLFGDLNSGALCQTLCPLRASDENVTHRAAKFQASAGLEEFIVLTALKITNANPSDSDQNEYRCWTINDTKVLIDLYGKWKQQVGTLKMKTMRKLWEKIAEELVKSLAINVTASNCENRWRVLERNYKKYIDNKKSTGRGRKVFECAEEMDLLFDKKRNIQPEILLSSNEVGKINGDNNSSISEAEPVQSIPGEIKTSQPVGSTPKSTKVKTVRSNRNSLLEKIRKDRLGYQRDRIAIEREKLVELRRRNDLIEERLRLIDQQNLRN